MTASKQTHKFFCLDALQVILWYHPKIWSVFLWNEIKLVLDVMSYEFFVKYNESSQKIEKLCLGFLYYQAEICN